MSTASAPSAADGYRPLTPADLAPGEARCLAAAGVIVARGQDGQYYAVERRCSHAALDLDGGRVRGASLVCPHHGARFDLRTGRVLGPPAHAPIAAYPTRVRDDMVEVWIYG